MTFQLPGDRNAIWIGVVVVGCKAIGTEETSEGIAVIAGWNPMKEDLVEQEFLFLRSV